MTKKMWRRQAKKDSNGRRDGRQIKYAAAMQEMMFRKMPRTYPLLNALFARVGIVTPTQKEPANEAN